MRIRLPFFAWLVLAAGWLLPNPVTAQRPTAPAPVAASADPVTSARMPPLPAPFTSAVRAHALRLLPGQDLRQELQRYAAAHGLRAASLQTCVGSLTTVALRFANQQGATTRTGHFEIVSLVGTLAAAGAHLHLAVADSTGQTFGGHLLEGCRIYTTAEIVLTELPDLEFTRPPDPLTTWAELQIQPVPPAGGRSKKTRP